MSTKILLTIMYPRILAKQMKDLGPSYVYHDLSVFYKQSASMTMNMMKKYVIFTLGCQRKLSRARQSDL